MIYIANSNKRIITSLLYIYLLIVSSLSFAAGFTYPGGVDIFETPQTPTNFNYAIDGKSIDISWSGGTDDGNVSSSYASPDELLTRSLTPLPCNGSCVNSKTFTIEVSENAGAYRILTSSNTNNNYRFQLTGKQNYRFRIKAVNVYTFATPYTYRSSGYLVSPLIAAPDPTNVIIEDIIPEHISPESDPDSSSSQSYFGSLRGKANINGNGSAQYIVPIIVPPGTAGMTPKLTLEYNSRNGNGLTGVGWSLTGFSTIHRCDNTLIQDGAYHSVDFSNADKFCLDGERLIAISGAYGANGTEYRTEVDQFSKIYSYGNATDGGPAYFVINTKGGEIVEYGNSNDSHIEAQGHNLANVWAVNKISDTVGNYQTFIYSEDSTNGEFYPTRINYSGNDNLDLLPNNSVRFIYDSTREDVQIGYSSGSKIKTSKLLNHIKTYVGNNLVKDYRLTYTATTLGNVSRISTINECDRLNNCKEPIQVSWLEAATENNISFEHTENNQNDARAWQEHTGISMVMAFWIFSGVL